MSMKEKRETKAKIAAIEAEIGDEDTADSILGRIKALEDAAKPTG